ncbi:MAG: hypothetical protein CMJ49_01825 [Planctomycetaceae bacterium]|nr:hypothetical protein [Planctomycetaceae bacterium]
MSDHFHELRTEELSVVVGDNTAHEDHVAGYNGIWHLSSMHDPPSLFVPSYCGMNFEFIAPMSRDDPTEPKDHPTELAVDEEGRQVTLHQLPTPTHRVESWMTYQTAGPAHLDWTFRYKLHDPGAFRPGAAGFFFASYIDRPENKSIYLLSRDVYDALMWIQFCTTYQGHDSAVTWDGDRYDVSFGPHDHGLYTARAPIRYHVPLMLGRQRDMAFVLMFEDPTGVIISHGMGGGGYVDDRSDRNPAWDFLLYVNDASANPTGKWNGRLIYKPFTGRDDVLVEYQQFQSELGHQWDIPTYGPGA